MLKNFWKALEIRARMYLLLSFGFGIASLFLRGGDQFLSLSMMIAFASITCFFYLEAKEETYGDWLTRPWWVEMRTGAISLGGIIGGMALLIYVGRTRHVWNEVYHPLTEHVIVLILSFAFVIHLLESERKHL